MWLVYCTGHLSDPIHLLAPQFAVFLPFVLLRFRLSLVMIAEYRSAVTLSFSLTRGVHNPILYSQCLYSSFLEGIKGFFCCNKSTFPSGMFVLFWFLRYTCDPLSDLFNYDDADSLLCPVRALQHYLRRTASFRAYKRRLFISINPKYRRDI